jgi:hypothetical protein
MVKVMIKNNAITPDEKTKTAFNYYSDDEYEYGKQQTKKSGHGTTINLGSNFPTGVEITYRFKKISDEVVNFIKLNKKRSLKEWCCPRHKQPLMLLKNKMYCCPLKSCSFIINDNFRTLKTQMMDEKTKETKDAKEEIKEFHKQEEKNKKKNNYFVSDGMK